MGEGGEGERGTLYKFLYGISFYIQFSYVGDMHLKTPPYSLQDRRLTNRDEGTREHKFDGMLWSDDGVENFSVFT